MPTPSTTSLPEIGSDVAPLVPDIPVASVRDIIPSDNEAADTRASSMQHVLRVLRRWWRALEDQRQRHRLRVSLLGLNERELKDIGITSAEIGHIAAHRAIDRLRNGTSYPWP